MHVNVVTDVPTVFWERQEPSSVGVTWEYSRQPLLADAYVVVGLTGPLHFPSQAAPRIFAVSEPPEVFAYDLRALARYDVVLAGDFPYLRSLPHVCHDTGMLPWRLGISLTSESAFASKPLDEILRSAHVPRPTSLSVVTSLKVMTPLQRQRIEFVEYLARHMPEVAVYGRDTRNIADKADALLAHSHHLALENSAHLRFWTEKLADPLLALTPTFYVGAPDINEEFSPEVVRAITLDSFDAAYRSISDRMSSHPAEPPALEAARAHILTFANLHAAVLRRLGDGEAFRHVQNPRASSVPAHRISPAERVRFLRERLRRNRAR